MKTGLVLGWWVQTYHDPRRPSHGRHSSAFGQGTQGVFENVSSGQSSAASIDSVVVGSRAFLSGDYGGDAGQPDDDPGREEGLGSGRSSVHLGNPGAAVRRGLLA